jgi:hypothetical protein
VVGSLSAVPQPGVDNWAELVARPVALSSGAGQHNASSEVTRPGLRTISFRWAVQGGRFIQMERMAPPSMGIIAPVM